MFDVAATVPLYAQIAVRLRAQIAAGEYGPGESIPSEHELAARFHVGRPTVRQATEILVRESVLERRRGSGTYVARPPAEVDLFSAAGTIASFRHSGVAEESRILGRVRRGQGPEGAPGLAGRPAFLVTRISSVRKTPVLLEEMYFDASVFVGLDRVALAGQSFSELARGKYLLRATRAAQKFQVVSLDRARAGHLRQKAGSSILKVERSVDFQGAPNAFFAELYCRTDHVVFTQVIALGGGEAGT